MDTTNRSPVMRSEAQLVIRRVMRGYSSRSQVAVTTKKGWAQVRAKKVYKTFYNRVKGWVESDLDVELPAVAQEKQPAIFKSQTLEELGLEVPKVDLAAWSQVWTDQEIALEERKQQELAQRALERRMTLAVQRESRRWAPLTWEAWVRQDIAARRSKYNLRLPSANYFRKMALRNKRSGQRAFNAAARRRMKKLRKKHAAQFALMVRLEEAMKRTYWSVSTSAPGKVVATSTKQVAKKWNRVEEDMTRLVDSFEVKTLKTRDIALLRKLRYSLDILRSRRAPQCARSFWTIRFLNRYSENYVPECVQAQAEDEEFELDATNHDNLTFIQTTLTGLKSNVMDKDTQEFVDNTLSQVTAMLDNPQDHTGAILLLKNQVETRMLNIIQDMQAKSQGGAASKVKQVTQDIHAIGNVATKVDSMLDEDTMMKGAEGIWAKMQAKLKHFGKFFSLDRLIIILSQIGHMIISPNIATVALGLATILVCLVGGTYEYISNVASSLGNWLKSLFTSKQTKGISVKGQAAETDGVMEVCGVIVSLLAGLIGWKMSDPGRTIETIRKLFWDFSLVGRGITGIGIILNHLLAFVRKTWDWLRNKVFYNGDKCYKLVDAPGRFKDWCKVAERLLHPQIMKEYDSYPDYADQIEKFYLEGTAYMATVKGDTFPHSCRVYLSELVKRLRAVREDLVKGGKFPFTRPVPFSVQMGGPPGIGKSTMITAVISKMLASINIVPKGNLYYKMEQINDHWDTFRGESAIVIDDAWNMRDTVSESKQVGAYYNLISSTPFTPPMASLEDKKIRANPVIVWANTNIDYPKPSVMNSYSALWRRRDMVIKASVRESHKHNYKSGKIDVSTYTEQEKQDYVWLEFKIYDDSTDEKSFCSVSGVLFTNLLETIKEKLRIHMKMQRKRIAEEMRVRLEAFKDIGDNDVDEMLSDIYKTIKAKANKDKESDTSGFNDALWEISSNLDILATASPQSVDNEIQYLFDVINDNNTTRKAIMEGAKAAAAACNIKLSDNIRVVGLRGNGVSKEFIKKAYNNSFSNEELAKVGFLLEYKKYLDEKALCSHVRCPCVQIIESGSKVYLYYSCDKDNAPCKDIAKFQEYDCTPECSLNSKRFLRDANYYSVDKNKYCIFMERIQENFIQRSLKLAKKKAKGRMSLIVRGIGKILVWFPLIVMPVIMVFAGAIALKEATKDIKLFKNKEKVCPDSYIKGFTEAQSAYEGPNNTRGTGKVQVRNLVVPVVQGQSKEDVYALLEPESKQYIDDCIRFINKNTYTLVAQYTYSGIVGNMRARGIFIRNNQFLTVRHSWDEICDRVKHRGAKLILTQMPDCQRELDFSKIYVERFQSSNYVLLTISGIPQHKNIIGYFATMRSHNYTTLRGKVVEIGNAVKVSDVRISYVTKPITVERTINSVDVPLFSSYEYDYGGAGVCGSILLCPDVNPCIIGMHVAGKASLVGYSEPLFQEMFRPVNYKHDIVDIVLPNVKQIDEKNFLDGNYITLGVVDAQYGHNESGVSNIVPSLVHGIFEVRTEPAPLSNRDPRLPPGCSPMYEGVKKHGQPIKGFPKHLIEFGSDSLKQMVRTGVKPILPMNVLSLQDAVCGRAGIQGFAPLNFSTSEGFPLTAYRENGAVGKKYLFDLTLTADGYILNGIDNKLKTILSIKQSLREKGIIPFTVFTDCLKDARIAKEKCSIPGKTRVFSTSPVDFSIQCRQYLLPYTVAHQNSRETFSSMVGINVNGKEWSQVVRKMTDFSSHQLCGDYSNFGAGFDEEVHRCVGEAILDWFEFNGCMDAKDQLVRKVLLMELVYPWHLCFDLLYQTYSGMPSGSPITVETNDLVNLMYILMAWHEIMSPVNLSSLFNFRKYVIIKTYGDDLWMSVHNNVIDRFNNVTISEFFAKYGVKYTDADKTGEMVPSKTWKEVSFLKRTPIPHPSRDGYYLACLDLKSSLDIANWCWKSKDPKMATLVNLEACADSIYGHGPEVHTHYRRILEREANKLGLVGNFRNWYELDNMFLKVSPQGDTDQGVEGSAGATMDTKEGTTIIEHRETSSDVGNVTVGMSWNQLTCSLDIDKPCGSENRWLPIANFKWDTTQVVGTHLLKVNQSNGMSLPFDGLSVNKSTPLAMRFKQHRYFRGDVIVKLIVNTNKFMVGQLQMSWFYGEGMDGTMALRDNRQCFSQMLHGRAQAGSSNTIELRIPYVYMFPYMTTAARSCDKAVLQLGKLYVTVFNRLACSSNAHTFGHCQLFMAVEDAHFCGMVDMTLGAFPQMDIAAGLAINAAESYLTQFVADMNRDMPPVPMIPNPVAIIGNGNLSYGTQVTDPVHVMRLNPTGQTPYIGLNRSSMDIQDVIRIFGYCNTIQWSTECNGKLLLELPAGPSLRNTDMEVILYKTLKFYGNSPLSVISSLFKQWRGTIEYRFDFVANDFYTGVVAVVYIPGATKAPSWEVAKCCEYTTFDLREERSFTFTVPFITDRIWWQRPIGLDVRGQYTYPGVICMYVINELSIMDSVPPSIDINIYQRAGCDFEFSVPVQPSLSSCLFTQYTPPSAGNIRAKDGYYPYYVGTSRYVHDNTKAVLRWGPTFDHLAQFEDTAESVTHKCYYTYSGTDAPYIREKKDNAWVQSKDKAIFAVSIKDPGNPWYWLLLCRTASDAISYVKKPNTKFLVDYPNDDVDTATYYAAENKVWNRCVVPTTNVTTRSQSQQPLTPTDLLNFSYPDLSGSGTPTFTGQGERDNPGMTLDNKGCLPSTSHGLYTFGERFSSLTDLLRRYQFCEKFYADVTAGSVGTCRTVLIKPYGMTPFTTTEDKQTLYAREGIHSLLSTGYKYFRGGVRVKMIFYPTDVIPVIVYVQHRPDNNDFIVDASTSVDKVLGQGYATHVQNIQQNPVIALEIPYYLESIYGNIGHLLKDGPTDVNRLAHLGRLYIIIKSAKNVTVRCDIYMAFADDTKFEIFQGFVPTINIDDQYL